MDNKLAIVKLITVGISFGSFLFVSRTLLRTFSKWRLLRFSGNVISNLVRCIENPRKNTTVISNHTQWDEVYQVLTKHCSEVPVVGFDCEWVTDGKITRPVALIQLASYQGTCALVRICCISTLPTTLLNLLSNPEILKVGVATWEDAKKLKKDANIIVRGTFDIRHLIDHHPDRESLVKKMGLSGLSERLLNVELNKKYTIRCSDWENDDLSDPQICYAAQDALASIALCLKLMTEARVHHTSLAFHQVQSHMAYCAKVCSAGRSDSKFRASGNHGSSSSIKHKTRTSSSSNLISKAASRAYAARKTPLYDNCILQAPDGQPLCTCDTKKALWYVTKGRGSVVCEEPMTVRLNFEPSGRPSTDYDQYYVMEKSNVCVVCGTTETILRKNIVPHEYRRHFPPFYKDHKSHDILLLCLDCHNRSNVWDNQLRDQLALECQAPIGTEKDVKFKLDRRLVSVQRAANALIQSKDSMPEARVRELEDKVKQHFQVQHLTSDLLETAQQLDVHVANPDYVPHGLKVVQHFHKEGDFGLLMLEKRWREHFVKTMNPQCLPALWSVEHHRKPEDKWSGQHNQSSYCS